MKLLLLLITFVFCSFAAQATEPDAFEKATRQAIQEKRRVGCEALLHLTLKGVGNVTLVRTHDFNLIALGSLPLGPHGFPGNYQTSQDLHVQLDRVETNPNFMRVQTIYDGQILTKFIGFDGRALALAKDLFNKNKRATESDLFLLSGPGASRKDPQEFFTSEHRRVLIRRGFAEQGAAIRIRDDVIIDVGEHYEEDGMSGEDLVPHSTLSFAVSQTHNEIAAFVNRGFGKSKILILNADDLASTGKVSEVDLLSVGLDPLVEKNSLRYSPDGRYLSVYPFGSGQPIIFRRNEAGKFVRLKMPDGIYIERPEFPGGERNFKGSLHALNPEFTGFVDSLYNDDSSKLALATNKGLVWIFDLESLKPEPVVIRPGKKER